MDKGYLSQGYYKKQRARIGIEVKDKEENFTYKSYSWTEPYLKEVEPMAGSLHRITGAISSMWT